MNIHIREATFKDLLSIVAVHTQSAQKAYKDVLPNRVIEQVFSYQTLWLNWQISFQQVRAYEKGKSDVNLKLLVAEKTTSNGQKKIIGVGQLPIKGSAAKVETLYVHPNDQGKTVGARILKKMAEIMSENNVSTVSVTTIHGNNTAEKFYETISGAKNKTATRMDIIEASHKRGVKAKPLSQKPYLCQFNTWSLDLKKMQTLDLEKLIIDNEMSKIKVKIPKPEFNKKQLPTAVFGCSRISHKRLFGYAVGRDCTGSILTPKNA